MHAMHEQDAVEVYMIWNDADGCWYSVGAVHETRRKGKEKYWEGGRKKAPNVYTKLGQAKNGLLYAVNQDIHFKVLGDGRPEYKYTTEEKHELGRERYQIVRMNVEWGDTVEW